MSTPTTTDVTGFVYCPPGWDETRLRIGPDAEAIGKIAMDTFTDISFLKEKNAIQIIGETHDEVYAAQNRLNDIFFPVTVKSKRQWARPDRPGGWGQRRDSPNTAPAGSPLRKMRSESSLGLTHNPPSSHSNGYHSQPLRHMNSTHFNSYNSHQNNNNNHYSSNNSNMNGYGGPSNHSPIPNNNGYGNGYPPRGGSSFGYNSHNSFNSSAQPVGGFASHGWR